MKVVGVYSFKNANEWLQAKCPDEIDDIYAAIAATESIERSVVNRTLRQEFRQREWRSYLIREEYDSQYDAPNFVPKSPTSLSRRKLEFVKNRVGLAAQFRNTSRVVYSTLAKMTIFHNSNVIDSAVEIAPTKDYADEMSSGVSYFEQIVWDLEHRGVGDIDIPVLILGVAP